MRTLMFRRALLAAAALFVLVVVAVLTLPVPVLEGRLTELAIARVRDQVACPGVLAKPPDVTVGGGRLSRQLIRGRLGKVTIVVPDATLNGVPHASFTGTLTQVTQPTPSSTHAASLDGTITVGFADLPADGDFHRADDGGLTVDVTVPAGASSNVRAKLFLAMKLSGETVRSVPQRLEIFGRTVPAAQVASLTGGVRTEKLPHLPDGVGYTSVSPRSDGVHVALSGVTTQPLSALPPSVGGRDVTYAVSDGLLGISTTGPLGVPLTIFAAPVLTGNRLVLTPRKVHILGGDHAPADPIGKLTLSQVDQKDLARTLPALPSGVRYRSVSIDAAGIKVALGGTTVKPYASLTQPPGRPTTFGAAGGLLTAVAKGSSGPTPIVLHARPAIHDATLDIAPSEIEMFGARFPAANVLAEVKGQQTTFPLQKLSPGLSYAGVTVLPDGLRIALTGRDVTLQRGSLTGRTC